MLKISALHSYMITFFFSLNNFATLFSLSGQMGQNSNSQGGVFFGTWKVVTSLDCFENSGVR